MSDEINISTTFKKSILAVIAEDQIARWNYLTNNLIRHTLSPHDKLNKLNKHLRVLVKFFFIFLILWGRRRCCRRARMTRCQLYS